MSRRRTILLAVTAALSVLAWGAWLAWDTEYQLDPVTDTTSGPYQPWQVVGCVLTLLVAAVVAGLAARSAVAAVWVTVPFTVCWAVSASLTDESGLFAVGAVLIAAGLYLGSWGVAAVVGAVPRRSVR